MTNGITHDEMNLLVQRFIDQELSGEERVRFVSRLGRDEVLRQRTLELEQLMLATARLPKPVVPENFVASVMARANPPSAAPVRRWWVRVTDAIWAPRRLQWNIASAAAMACMAFIVVGSIIALRVEPASPPTAAQPTAGNEAAPAVLVRLVVMQPNAQSVAVAGDFNGWNPSRTPLEQIGTGAWAVTIPLKPGRYEYMFVVDGKQWIADPFATEHNDDGFGSRNAVLEVRPPSGAQL